MGLFDTVHAEGPEFVCDQGHAVGPFQTKDLGETMGSATITDGLLAVEAGGWGRGEPDGPITEMITIYGTCDECPAFVQAGTLNLAGHGVEFEVDVVENRVVSVERVSETLAEFLEREPREPYMRGCHGPMPFAEAMEMRANGLRRAAASSAP